MEASYEIWSDEQIEPGGRWRDEIKKAIENADVAILLVTPEFLASEFNMKNELPPLLRKESDRRGINIIHLIIKSSAFKLVANISQFQAFNGPDKPFSDLQDQEQGKKFVELAIKLNDLLKKTVQIADDEIVEDPSPQIEDVVRETVQEENLILPQNLSDRQCLVFDIDGTVLNKGEKLSDRNHEQTLDLFEFFVKRGFHIVFITGNDYELQKERVLKPIIARSIASSVTCFADGGSRLFEFDENKGENGEYVVSAEYSNNNLITKSQRAAITNEFKIALEKFVEYDENKELSIPDVFEIEREYHSNGKLKYVELMIRPLKTEYFENNFGLLAQEIEKIAAEADMQSVCQVMDKYRSPNSLIFRMNGPLAGDESNTIRNQLVSRFAFWKQFKNIAAPEIEERGTKGEKGADDFISQIAIKPFKREKARIEFLTDIRKRLAGEHIQGEFSVIKGGSTTIDIQLKGVDKRKAIVELVLGNRRLDPRKMIYFGDEFVDNGNDLPVALMEKDFRPGRIIHVGKNKQTSEKIESQNDVFVDKNGPQGTLNYLRFLKYQIELD